MEEVFLLVEKIRNTSMTDDYDRKVLVLEGDDVLKWSPVLRSLTCTGQCRLLLKREVGRTFIEKWDVDPIFSCANHLYLAIRFRDVAISILRERRAVLREDELELFLEQFIAVALFAFGRAIKECDRSGDVDAFLRSFDFHFRRHTGAFCLFTSGKCSDFPSLEFWGKSSAVDSSFVEAVRAGFLLSRVDSRTYQIQRIGDPKDMRESLELDFLPPELGSDSEAQAKAEEMQSKYAKMALLFEELSRFA